jgi:tetratricopeptide (TPR) repeat protein
VTTTVPRAAAPCAVRPRTIAAATPGAVAVRPLAISAMVFASACASALHEPSPIAAYAPDQAHGRSADQLVAEANAAWAHRAERGRAAAAQGLYLDAAVADAHRVDALVGAMRALSYRIEYEPGAPREKLAGEEVELGQWCRRRAPAEAECDYRLAIALGQQARERPSTGKDAMGKIVDLLHHAIARAPQLDSGGPHRVLALVFLRAPSWPIGPGDPDAGLDEARAAVRLAPAAAANQLALGEALAATGDRAEAHAAYRRALDLATAARTPADPETASWLAQARAGLAK